MTKTAIGRQRMNNATLLSRPSYGCAISMECGTFESLLAPCLAVFNHISHCKLGRELIYFSRQNEMEQIGCLITGGKLYILEEFHQLYLFKGLRWLLWKLQHKWDLGSLFALTGPGPRLLSGLTLVQTTCMQTACVQTACVQRCCDSRLLLWILFVSQAARRDPAFGFLHFYSLSLCVCSRANQSRLWSQPCQSRTP